MWPVHFRRSESYNNHRLIDTTLEYARDALTTPEVVHELGERTFHLLAILDRIYVPNVQHGTIERGNMPDDGIPIVAATSSDTLILDELNRIPSQEQIDLSRELIQPNEEIFQSLLSNLRDTPCPLTLTSSNPASTQAASVTVLYGNSPNHSGHRMYGRPAILLNRNLTKEAQRPETSLHEFMHAYLFQRTPAYAVDDSWSEVAEALSGELQCYSVGAAIVRGNEKAGKSKGKRSKVAVRSLQVEQVRIESIDDPNRPWQSSERIARR